MIPRTRGITRAARFPDGRRTVMAWGTGRSGRTVALAWLPENAANMPQLWVLWPSWWEIGILDGE